MADAGFGGIFSGEFVNFSHVLLSSKLGESTWGERKGTSQSRKNKELPTPQPCTVSTSKVRNFPSLISEQHSGGTGKVSHLGSKKLPPGICINRQKFHHKLNTGRCSLIQCTRTGAVFTRHSTAFMENCLNVSQEAWSHHQSCKVTAGVLLPALRGFSSLHLHKDTVWYLCPEIQW